MQKNTKHILYFLNSILLVFFIGCFWVLSPIHTYAETPVERYNQRVENICEPYRSQYSFFQTTAHEILEDKTDKLARWEQALSLFEILENTSERHVENMDGIYQCWILEVRKNTLKQITQKLIKWVLKARIWDKIDAEIRRIDLSYTSLWCSSPSDTSINKKVELLKQTTYELCSYHSYLEYLREYSENLWNLIDQESTPISQIPALQSQIITQIDNEIDRSYKLFDIAYSSYSDYENYFTTHVLLELIKEDLVAFRRGYHDVINPINQVIYKISNATRRP